LFKNLVEIGCREVELHVSELELLIYYEDRDGT